MNESDSNCDSEADGFRVRWLRMLADLEGSLVKVEKMEKGLVEGFLVRGVTLLEGLLGLVNAIGLFINKILGVIPVFGVFTVGGGGVVVKWWIGEEWGLVREEGASVFVVGFFVDVEIVEDVVEEDVTNPIGKTLNTVLLVLNIKLTFQEQWIIDNFHLFMSR